MFDITCDLLYYSIPVLILNKSSRGGLGVERWSDNRLDSAMVDRIVLGETLPAMNIFYVYMDPTPTDV